MCEGDCVDASQWDERYRDNEQVWSDAPNVWVKEVLGNHQPGSALDVGAGEGRNSVWLAQSGWHVTAVDFSKVAIEKLTQRAEDLGVADRVVGVVADATDLPAMAPVDVALMCYVQLPETQRRAAVLSSASKVKPGGWLVVVAHDSSNLKRGAGGPQDPAVLYSPRDIMSDLATSGVEWRAQRAHVVARPVPGSPRPARDALVVAVRSE